MITYYDPNHAAHDPAGLRRAGDPGDRFYVEVPARAVAIRDALVGAGLTKPRPPRDFGLAPIAAIHHPGLIAAVREGHARVAAAGGMTRPVVPDTYWTDGAWARPVRSVYASLGLHCYDTSSPLLAGTWDAAYAGAQTALSAAAAVAAGAMDDPCCLAYALCRPPGHHARADRYGGFCYLNNVAIAAHWLAGQGRRVAILDVDYHHGNGTQGIFYERPDVYFASLHADPVEEYPFFWGYADETGAGAGAGTTLNLPLPLGAGPDRYLDALDRALAAVAAYRPNVLLVSLGFDTAAGDPTGTFRLAPADFAAMAARIAALRLPAVVVQEGGYAVNRLGDLAIAFFRGWLAHCG